jgi:hypothetical protein
MFTIMAEGNAGICGLVREMYLAPSRDYYNSLSPFIKHFVECDNHFSSALSQST